MTISVASAFYNDEKMLALTLKSILEQTYQDIEYIVADGGSNDGTVALLKEYEDKFREVGKKLVWKSEKDNGLYEAFNKAASMATGDYLIFGTDPYINRNVFADLAQDLARTNADYVYGGMYFQKNGKIIRCWSGKPGNWRLGWMAATPTLCMKRAVWEKYGPMDEKYKSASDYKFQLSLFRDKALRSYPLNRVLVMYYAGGTSNGGIKANVNSILECNEILRESHVRFGWFTNLCKTAIAFFAYTFASRKQVILEEEQP